MRIEASFEEGSSLIKSEESSRGNYARRATHPFPRRWTGELMAAGKQPQAVTIETIRFNVQNGTGVV